MKWTQADEFLASRLQSHLLTHETDNVRPILNLTFLIVSVNHEHDFPLPHPPPEVLTWSISQPKGASGGISVCEKKI
jgi:hypothetical protein